MGWAGCHFLCLGICAHRLHHFCYTCGWGAAMGFSRAFCQSTLRTRRLYLVDGYAIFHAFAHAIASIDRGTHPGAAISRMVQYPAWWRNFVADLLERGSQSRQAAFLSSICIRAMMTVAFWSPICIFIFVITHDHGATFNTMLWIFGTFAWDIGGI